MGSDKDAERKIYIYICLEPSRPTRSTLLWSRKRNTVVVSYEEDYDIDGMCYKVSFAGPQNDIGNRNHHGVALAVKATGWAE